MRARALKGKLIQQISLSITCSGSGSGSSSKVLTFHKANYQSLNTGVRGSAQVGDTLGTLTGKFYSKYRDAYLERLDQCCDCFQR